MGRPRLESELVAHARRGDLDAFEQLVREHQGIAFRTAYVISGSAADAEEAVQDAFVKAHRALGRFREGAPFRPWLLAIVANEARNRWRSAARFELHLAEERPSADGPVSGGGAPRPRAARAAARRDRDAGGGAAPGRRVPPPPRPLRARDRGGARLPPRHRQVEARARARSAGGGAVSARFDSRLSRALARLEEEL